MAAVSPYLIRLDGLPDSTAVWKGGEEKTIKRQRGGLAPRAAAVASQEEQQQQHNLLTGQKRKKPIGSLRSMEENCAPAGTGRPRSSNACHQVNGARRAEGGKTVATLASKSQSSPSLCPVETFFF